MTLLAGSRVGRFRHFEPRVGVRIYEEFQDAWIVGVRPPVVGPVFFLMLNMEAAAREGSIRLLELEWIW